MNTVIDLLAEEAELHDGVEGHACAVVSIKDNDGFVADTLYANENNNRPIFVLVTQTKDLNGGLSALGVAIRLFYDQAGKPSVQSVFAVVDSGTYLAHRINQRDVLWDQDSRQLTIDFDVDFRFGGESFNMANGRIELKV